MINVAIVDDEEDIYLLLKQYFNRFSAENDVSFNLTWFSDAVKFLDPYRAPDLVFMDIEMPYMTGMLAANKLREIDSTVALVFVTNLSQYAIKGYSVDALDYVLKPVQYSRFSSLLKKTLRYLGQNTDTEISVKTTGGIRRIFCSTIICVEIKDHLCVWHTENERIETWNTLKEAEGLLPQDSFVRCNHSCIVNLKHVKSVEKDMVYLRGDNHPPISVSHSKKKEFMSRLNKHMGL